MKVFRHLDELPRELGPTIVSVGNFDGVHLAHQKVVAEIVRRARAIHGASMVVTFDPHPMRVLRPDDCNGGTCEDSEFAALSLRDAGVPSNKLFVYIGGFAEWVTNGLPVELGPRKSGRLQEAGK